MTTLARSYSLSYGALSIGGISTKYLLHGPINRAASYSKETISCIVIVKSTGAINLPGDCQALIDLIRVPRADLTVVQGTKTDTYTEGSNCISIAASCMRAPGGFDSHLSRAFALTFTVVRTASDASDEGLVDYSFSESIGTNGVRLINVQASFTQHNGDSAEAVYATLFDDLLATIKTRVDPDPDVEWEESLRTVSYDRFNQTLAVSTSLAERIFGEKEDGTFDQTIKDQVMFLSIMEKPTSGLEEAATTVPRIFAIMYACSVDKSFTQDLVATYNTLCRPAIVSYLESVAAGSSRPIQLTNEVLNLDPITNTIKAELTFRVYGLSNVLQAIYSEGYRFRPPVQKIPTYELNGFGRLRLPGIGACQFVTKASVTAIGDVGNALTLARGLTKKPTRLVFGGSHRPVDNSPMSRQQYNDAGVSGSGWTKESEEYDHEGPFYDDGDPPITYATASTTILWDLDVDPTNVDGGSLERGD